MTKKRSRAVWTMGSPVRRVHRPTMTMSTKHIAANNDLKATDAKNRISRNRETFNDDRASELTRAHNDPRYNEGLSRLIEDGQAHSVHDYLDEIINNPAVKTEQPHLTWLARILKGRLPDTLEVRPASQHKGLETSGAYTYRPGEAAPTAERSRITLNPAETDKVTTILHEGLHAVTTDYLEHLKSSDPDYKVLQLIQGELRDALKKAAPATKQMIARLNYTLSDIYETHTMLLTDPYVQQLAASHTPSNGFLRMMEHYGYGITPKAPKSIWSYFTSWVKNAIGIKSSILGGARNSLLDHIMRPLQDITDRAHEYNVEKAQTGGDPIFHEPLTTADQVRDLLDRVAGHALPSFKGAKDDVIRRADFGGMGDKARRAVLQGATTDGIVEWNKSLLPPVENYRSATEAVAARSAKFRNDHAEDASDLATRMKGNDKLADLMNDATLNRVQLGSSANNAHLTTAAEITKMRALEARFNAL